MMMDDIPSLIRYSLGKRKSGDGCEARNDFLCDATSNQRLIDKYREQKYFVWRITVQIRTNHPIHLKGTYCLVE